MVIYVKLKINFENGQTAHRDASGYIATGDDARWQCRLIRRYRRT